MRTEYSPYSLLAEANRLISESRKNEGFLPNYEKQIISLLNASESYPNMSTYQLSLAHKYLADLYASLEITGSAIDHYEIALQMNPKIAVKKKLKQLKSIPAKALVYSLDPNLASEPDYSNLESGIAEISSQFAASAGDLVEMPDISPGMSVTENNIMHTDALKILQKGFTESNKNYDPEWEMDVEQQLFKPYELLKLTYEKNQGRKIMTLKQEQELLDALLNFTVPVIPDATRFWMIRTQKGYFYDEFLAKKYVALAWNSIDSSADFSDQSKERLQDDIMLKYSEINRPSTVVNKCKNFIHEVKENDILVIPSKGSRFITFALAGEYFEDSSKTIDLEHTVISRIQNNDVDIHDVSCPYKKRRHIKLLRTVRSENLNYSLYRAISNYHGISNFDFYANQILNTLYNYYSYKGTAVLVYNICKTGPIKPRELAGLLYANTECLSMIIDENYLSTQISLNSPGDAVYILEKVYTLAKDNWTVLFGLLVFLGGGSALSFHIPGIIDIIKNIINAPSEIRMKKNDAEIKQLEVLEKRLDVYNKIKSFGIDPKDLQDPLNALNKYTQSLDTCPIILGDDSSILSPEDEAPLVHDLEDDQ